jgi:hypothetical protein
MPAHRANGSQALPAAADGGQIPGQLLPARPMVAAWQWWPLIAQPGCGCSLLHLHGPTVSKGERREEEKDLKAADPKDLETAAKETTVAVCLWVFRIRMLGSVVSAHA